MAKAASIASLMARQIARKIDNANDKARAGAPRPTKVSRVVTCRCTIPEQCPHVVRPEGGGAKSPLAIIRNTGFEKDPDRYDPVTHLKLPTAYAALCTRCGMFHCVCGRVAEVEAILARRRANGG